MDATKNWTVTIEISEHDGHTRAVAKLHTGKNDEIAGLGFARLNPVDKDVPDIGDEIAAARALSDLSRRLLGTATDDIEQNSGAPAHLVM
ncbi:DUF1876 domain-containing protein [Geodermatophilus ruber]|uniref:DUF1876 domain-containing protein n=1 Tax=Geodermatophilus ruber TaxID=504800 RepID=A0A1I4HNN3_9ACTN|nr:DUF1876 domain-containing protein [Geodermatophilus ruber]SFL43357.1 protein of unknown function [Geodermatophilus ruber]